MVPDADAITWERIMPISHVEPADYAGFLDLVNAEIRPDRAKTNAEDDFPVILGPENGLWQLIYKTDEGEIAGCIAALIRVLKTSCGEIPVAGVGSVVTRPNFRGKGLSSALQNALLERLRGKNIPLAVLWTDQPEIYSGRGFDAAGWEIHVSLADWRGAEGVGQGLSIRPYEGSCLSAVEEIYARHPWHTLRMKGDSAAYYGMPGTRGFTAHDLGGRMLAYVFCGKGADFPGYACEWGGQRRALLSLLDHARGQGLVENILVPAGAQNIVNTLVDGGCGWWAVPSGQWAVLDPVALQVCLGAEGASAQDLESPAFWLGSLDEEGQPLPGAITAGIWGFDSV